MKTKEELRIYNREWAREGKRSSSSKEKFKEYDRKRAKAESRRVKAREWFFKNKEKAKGMKKVTKNGVVTIEVQLGQKWKGESVADVRKLYTEGEIGLGVYEVLTILLISPEILQSYDDLWLDCPGDEFDYAVSHVRFDRAAYLGFDGGLEFGTNEVSAAYESFGSVSGFVPQANLESGNLEPSESLDTLSAIKLLKDEGFTITKVY